MSSRDLFPDSQVRVVRLYEIRCETCNGNPGSEFFDTRREADAARRAHLAAHRRPEELGWLATQAERNQP